jgi:uncharacterized protein (DUF2342 family)
MIKLALYSAWARLQIASNEQSYLVPIVKPYTAMLTPLWLSSLQEYARLRFEPDISSSMGSTAFSDNLDDVYAALNRETLLTVSTFLPMDIYCSLRFADGVFAVLPRLMAELGGCHRQPCGEGY